MSAFRLHIWLSSSLLSLALCVGGVTQAQPARSLTLDKIMADPAWFSPHIGDPWWSWDN